MEKEQAALPGRSLAEIRASLGAHLRMAAENCILAGRDLIEAKELLGHGNFGAFLAEYGISTSTAANWMRVAREIAPGSSLAALPYGKALALLAVPAEEREQVAQEIHAEEKSAAEIKRLIDQRNKAVEAANTESNRADRLARDRDYWKTQAEQADAERRDMERALEKMANQKTERTRVEVPPADYEEMKRRARMADQLVDDAERAAIEAEKRAQEAEERLSALESQGSGRPAPDGIEALGAAVAQFISATQMMLVNPGPLAAREKDTDALIRQLSRHVIDLQRAVSNAAFDGEGAVV